MKSIIHYFDWFGTKDKTRCGVELTSSNFVYWHTSWRGVTCKRCRKYQKKLKKSIKGA